MRSFPVRSASFLVIVLLLAAWFVRLDRSGASPGDDPLPADRRDVGRLPAKAALLRPPRTVETPLPAPDPIVASYRAQIDELDRDSSGFFSQELDRVLSDPDESVPVLDFRLPVKGGVDAMLNAFNDADPSHVEDQRRFVLVYVASSFHGCDSDAERRKRLDALIGLHPALSGYLARQ
jgi:hypothetical protein